MLFSSTLCIVALLSTFRATHAAAVTLTRTSTVLSSRHAFSGAFPLACSNKNDILTDKAAFCPSSRSKDQFIMTPSNIDVLTTSATELQELLSLGLVSSGELVKLYLRQVEKHNHQGVRLNAMISTAPVDLLMQRAKLLDEERAAGKLRSPLHGIPISVKDNILTHPSLGMGSTCGAASLVGAKPRSNAPLVERLLKAGLIIIGKANLSELAGWKDNDIITGWSAVGGQTQSPYVVGGVVPGEKFVGHSTPAGSSSGSAAGVAAGFAPLSMATETDGSITQPASRAALYGMKVTVGAVPTNGTSPWSSLTDSAGGMAKTSEDLASLIGIMMDGKDFSGSLTKSWKGLKVGFVDPEDWPFSPHAALPDPKFVEQQREAYAAAAQKVISSGGNVKEKVPIPFMEDMVMDGEDLLSQLFDHDFAPSFNKFLEDYEEVGIHTVAEMVAWNKENSDRGLPQPFTQQRLLEGALNKNMSSEKYAQGIKILREKANTNGLDKTLADYDLDVIIGPQDSRVGSVAACAGYPSSTVPLGLSKTNGRGFGMTIIAGAGQEAKIFHAMSAWEETMPKRQPPPQLLISSNL